MEYGYQGIDPGSKVWYLLNGTRCDKLSTAVTIVRTDPDKNKKNFDTVVTFLTQYIEKNVPTPSVNVVFAGQTRPAKLHKTSTIDGTFKRMIELKKYSRKEYHSMLITQHQQLYELQKEPDW